MLILHQLGFDNVLNFFDADAFIGQRQRSGCFDNLTSHRHDF